MLHLLRRLLPIALIALTAQSFSTPRALDNTAITGSAINALTGPANGCNISSTSALIIDLVNAAGTSPSNTSQLQPAGATPFQCGPIKAGVVVSVNCSGGGSCNIQGMRW